MAILTASTPALPSMSEYGPLMSVMKPIFTTSSEICAAAGVAAPIDAKTVIAQAMLLI